MLKFLKEHSYDIFRLFLDQIAMAVFGLVMSAATAQYDNIFLAVGIFGVALYLVIVYITARSVGEKDYAPVKAGRKAATPLKGLWLGLCANAVNIICGIIIFVCTFYIVAQPAAYIYNEAGEKISVYYKDAATENLIEVPNLYSGHGDDIFAYDNGKSEIDVRPSDDSHSQPLTVYDKDGNEIKLYGRGLNANVEQGYLENAATKPYSISYLICTFLQSFFSPIKYVFFNTADYFFLLTPILPIIVAALGYYLASKGKRLLPFLPERNIPKKYR